MPALVKIPNVDSPISRKFSLSTLAPREGYNFYADIVPAMFFPSISLAQLMLVFTASIIFSKY